jgi:hypothetical protein
MCERIHPSSLRRKPQPDALRELGQIRRAVEALQDQQKTWVKALAEHRHNQSTCDAYLQQQIDEQKEELAHLRYALRIGDPELSALPLTASSSSSAGR